MAGTKRRGRPRGTKKYDRQVCVRLPRGLLDLIEERSAKERTKISEAIRRCLQEYRALKLDLETGKILVSVSREDREAVSRLVGMEIVPSFEYAVTEAIRRYPQLVLREREERNKAIGSV